MSKLRRAIVAQLNIIGIRIQNNRTAILRALRSLAANELTAINQHTLTALAMACDPGIRRAIDPTISQMKNHARRGHQDATGNVVT